MLNPRVTAVLERWNRFQQQLYQRFTEVLTEAERGCAALLVEREHDPTTMGNAWTAMHARAVDLGARLQDTWNDEIIQRLAALCVDASVEQHARQQLEQLQDRMEIELEATRLRVFADAARSVWARAAQHAPASLHCSECAAPLPVPATFQAIDVPCSRCCARTPYEPGARIRMLAPFCVHPLCEETAWDEWLSMRRAEQRLHAAPDETLPLLQAYERSQIAYWYKYLSARTAMLPDAAPSFDADLRAKLQQWYTQVDHHAAWARAGRPRALP